MRLSKDARFIAWKDFVNKYGGNEYYTARTVSRRKDNYNCTHRRNNRARQTDRTFGLCNKFGCISDIYNALRYCSLDTFCQLVPPIVAYSLENMHFTRFMQMNTFLIATYNRNEFPKIVLKTRANHYNVVPSLQKL